LEHYPNQKSPTDSAEEPKVFSDHAIYVFDLMAANPELERAKRILGWIKRKECHEFTKRDCHRGLQQHFLRVDDLTEALNILVERDIIRLEVSPKKEGRPSSKYTVNPAVFQGGQDYGMA